MSHEHVHIEEAEFAAYDNLRHEQVYWQQTRVAKQYITFNKYKEVKRIIKAESNTDADAKRRKHSWQKD